VKIQASLKGYLDNLLSQNELHLGSKKESGISIFDHDVLSKNLKKFESLYSQQLSEAHTLDERYFILQNQKLKTPMKMSPFGARTGPMQRFSSGSQMNPPAPPSKKNLFGKTPSSAMVLDQESPEPPSKRQNFSGSSHQNKAPI